MFQEALVMWFRRSGLLLLASLAPFYAAIPAHAECDEWPCFDDTEKPGADQSWKNHHSSTLDNYAKNLRILNAARVIRVSSEQVVSSDLRSLIGQYALIEKADGRETVTPIGTTYAPPLREIKIKDESVFNGIVTRGFNAGAKLPVLQIDLGAKDVAELSVDIISAAFVESNANKISCNFPIAFADDAKTGKAKVVFISGANVTRVRKQFFKEGNAGASGAFAIVSLNGKTYISDKTTLTDYIVLPSFVEARPVDPNLCPRKHHGGKKVANLESAAEIPTTRFAQDLKPRIAKPSELESLLASQKKIFGSLKGSEMKLDAAKK